MIDIIFYHGTEIAFVRVIGNHVQFATSMFGSIMAPIDGLKLSYAGVIKEHPDLKDNDNWKDEAINRFKDYVSSLQSEKEIADYLVEDLRKHGYIPKFKQVQGFRKEILK